MSAPLLRVDQVGRQLGRGGRATVLLAPVSFTLAFGELVVVAGPSGSGKTTLCNLLLGWDRPDQGAIEWSAPIGRDGWSVRSAAPQRLALLEQLTVWENLALAASAGATEREPATLGEEPGGEIDRLLTSLDLSALADRWPAELSFGEQQRVAVGRALVGRPTLAVLDEPTGHQDEAHAESMIAELRAAPARGITVFAASHDRSLVEAADRVIELHPAHHRPAG